MEARQRVNFPSAVLRLICQTLEFIVHELDLRADDDLHGGLAGTDDPGCPGGFQFLFVHPEGSRTSSRSRVTQWSMDVRFSFPPRPSRILFAISVKSLLVGSNVSSPAVDSSRPGVIRLNFLNGKVEYQKEHRKGRQSQRQDQPGFRRCGRDAEKIRSVAPAEKQKPARKPRATVTAAKIP